MRRWGRRRLCARRRGDARNADHLAGLDELRAVNRAMGRPLDALVGNDEQRRLAWMRSHNEALNGTPASLILSVQGLVTTLAYVDSMRAPV